MTKALILLNMGGPNSLEEVELFLKNMFNDENIITVKNSLLRSLIAFIIVNSRKNEAISNYEKLGGKSPIIEHTQKLVSKLQSKLENTKVDYVMRYTPPFAKDVIEKLKKEGIKEITLLPLYPQYSSTTTKSSLEDFYAHARGFKVKHIERFFNNKTYNELLVHKIEEELQNKNASDFELIFSAHSLPQKIIDSGDTYQEEILLHVELLKKILKEKKLNFKDVHIAYQSKLGPVKWLEPSLEDKLKSLTCKKVIISPISFTIDNSETEFELCIEYKKIAKNLNFTEYLVAKCPNDDNAFVKFLIQISNL
jgi:ferrochelatase